MITPGYSITATERVLPRLALDFTTGSLDARVTVTRALNTATRVNSSGYIETVNANLPRFDYDPSTLLPKGLLIEETRQNRVLYSNDGTNSWNSRRGTAAKTATGPDNVANSATTFTATNTNGNLRQRIIATSSTCITSAYIKRRTGTGAVLLSQSEPTGSDFVVNGNFSSVTGWYTDTGWAINTTAQTATFTAAGINSPLYNTFNSTVTAGNTYVLQYTVVSNTLSGGLFRVGGYTGSSIVGGSQVINLDTSVGTHRYAFVSETAGSQDTLDLWVTSGAATGALTISNVSVFSVVETTLTITNSWTRVNLSSVTLAQPSIVLKLAANGDAIDIYGVQNENGATVTSVIPTDAAAVTRNADDVQMTGTNFSSWFNSSQGTFEVEYQTALTAFTLLNSQNSGDALLYSSSADAKSFNGASGVATANTGSTTTPNTAGLSYTTNNRQIALNGGTVASNTGDLQTLTSIRFGQSFNFGGWLNGYVRKVNYWPQQVTTAELQAFSK